MPPDKEQEKGTKSTPPHPLVTEQSEHAQSPPPSKKPRMTAAAHTSSDLMSRLNSFLPAMEAANKNLQVEIEDGTAGKRNIEVLDEEGEGYIEMNLGLGVLEEKRDEDVSGTSESEGEEGKAARDGEEDHDVLLRLLNSSRRHGKGPRGKPYIEVVEHSEDTPGPEKERGHHAGTERK
ncbi:unnamed protein product [Tuber aestivum]|uniref:Uncharacterized protein n=1 Tax=Tuber aestivum TaxID=59557 RepID=A0A292PQ06_9PEZI|nr:unnamed protein product [Tuber aestivum]